MFWIYAKIIKIEEQLREFLMIVHYRHAVHLRDSSVRKGTYRSLKVLSMQGNGVPGCKGMILVYVHLMHSPLRTANVFLRNILR